MNEPWSLWATRLDAREPLPDLVTSSIVALSAGAPVEHEDFADRAGVPLRTRAALPLIVAARASDTRGADCHRDVALPIDRAVHPRDCRGRASRAAAARATSASGPAGAARASVCARVVAAVHDSLGTAVPAQAAGLSSSPVATFSPRSRGQCAVDDGDVGRDDSEREACPAAQASSTRRAPASTGATSTAPGACSRRQLASMGAASASTTVARVSRAAGGRREGRGVVVALELAYSAAGQSGVSGHSAVSLPPRRALTPGLADSGCPTH